MYAWYNNAKNFGSGVHCWFVEALKLWLKSHDNDKYIDGEQIEQFR